MFSYQLCAATLTLCLVAASTAQADTEARLHGLHQRERLLERADLVPLLRPAVLPRGMVRSDADLAVHYERHGLPSSPNGFIPQESRARFARRVEASKFAARRAAAARAQDSDALRQLHMPLPIQIRAASNDASDDVADNWDCDEAAYTTSATPYTPPAPTTSNAPATSSPVTPQAPPPSLPAGASLVYLQSGVYTLSAPQAAAPVASATASTSSAALPQAKVLHANLAADATAYYTPSASLQGASLNVAPANSSSLAPKLPTFFFDGTTPSNIPNGTLTAEQGCNRYYTVKKGDICLQIIQLSSDLNLTLSELYSYNPSIDNSCFNLHVNWNVCIGANPTLAAKAIALRKPSTSTKLVLATSTSTSYTTTQTAVETVNAPLAVITLLSTLGAIRR